MKKLFTLLLALCLLSGTAMAFTFEELDREDVLDPELIQQETISSWAQAEVYAAISAGLVPQFSGDPAYQDTITREQFAELIVQTVETALGRELAAAPRRYLQRYRKPRHSEGRPGGHCHRRGFRALRP